MTSSSQSSRNNPGVTVVIPTVGRPELARALDSVRRQDYDGTIEVIVVVDKPDGTVDGQLLKGVDVVLYTGGGRRAGAARNLGIAHSTQPYVALLDDDDEWMPWKLSAQMPEFAATGAEVIGTQAVYRNAATGTASPPVPTKVKQAGQTYAEYLFRKRSARVGRPVIFGITLIVSTELARRARWDETLTRHQDWDWVDRMEQQGATIIQLPQASATVWTGSEGSISSAPDWRASLAWAETRRGAWDPGVLADFLAGQALRYALQSRSPVGVLRSLAAVARTRRFPSFQSLVLGLIGIVPRTLINKRMTKKR